MNKKDTLPQTREKKSREWHPNYVEYTEMIVGHPNYNGLPYNRDKKSNRIKWVVTGKSVQGQARKAWWNEQCKKFNIPIQQGCYALVARLIHPTGMHVCQICGQSRSIFYIYPTKTTIKNLKKKLPIFAKFNNVAPADYSIYEIIDMCCSNLAEVNYVATILGLEPVVSKEQLKNEIKDKLANGNTSKLSPGVMSNPPDRLDGFHSDGLCCREDSDGGRWPLNLSTYAQDRRAYENWSDGDYNLANRLMGEFKKDESLYECPKCHGMKRMTADHIGPISLGFCHSLFFAPLCTSCNSAKNNRLTYNDVQFLLKKEKEGKTVVSWHAKYIWDIIKNKITDDDTAKKASSLMAEFHQNVLYILSVIYKETGENYLMRFLHPEYSLVDYRFENFNPFKLEELVIKSKPLESENKKKNQERAVRIAFEALDEFMEKGNRRHKIHFEEGQPEIGGIIMAINDGDFAGADQCLFMLLETFAHDLVSKKWSV